MSLYLSEKHSCFENKQQPFYRLKRDLRHKTLTSFSGNHSDRRLIRANLEPICPSAEQAALTLHVNRPVFSTQSVSHPEVCAPTAPGLCLQLLWPQLPWICVIISKKASLI